MTIRTYTAVIEIACCRDGVKVYNPLPKTVFREVKKPYFKETINKWKKRIEILLDKKYRKRAKDECDKVGTRKLCMFDMVLTVSEELEKIVTGTTYRILRMAARGKSHIYGLSDKEFYKRMSKTREKYTQAQSNELLKLFKQGLIKTKVKV